MQNNNSCVVFNGRNFSASMITDSSGVLMNETAACLLGYANPVDKPLYRSAHPGDAFKILGVITDFNDVSLHDKAEPIVLHFADNRQAVKVYPLAPG